MHHFRIARRFFFRLFTIVAKLISSTFVIQWCPDGWNNTFFQLFSDTLIFPIMYKAIASFTTPRHHPLGANLSHFLPATFFPSSCFVADLTLISSRVVPHSKTKIFPLVFHKIDSFRLKDLKLSHCPRFLVSRRRKYSNQESTYFSVS